MRYPELQDAEWLAARYTTDALPAEEIAALVGCTRAAVYYSLRKFQIPVRDRSHGKQRPRLCARADCCVTFAPRGPAQKFCSAICRAGSKLCDRPECGITFAMTPPRVVRGTAYPRRFCSKLCRNLWFRAIARNRFAPDAGGYIRIVLPDGSRVLEHRHVMSESLGRPLEESETVHHVDGDTANNSLENLQLRQGNHGKGAAFQCRSCGSHDIVAVELGHTPLEGLSMSSNEGEVVMTTTEKVAP